jgi:hypothetical protein
MTKTFDPVVGALFAILWIIIAHMWLLYGHGGAQEWKLQTGSGRRKHINCSYYSHV